MDQTTSQDEKTKLHSELGSELFNYDMELAEIAQKKLFRRANRYQVPIPWRSKEDWEDWGFVRLLKPEASLALRREINAEQKECRERWGFWFFVVIALIGALTGLVSVIKN